nr:hypothetical protein [Chlamydia sp.]
MSVLEESHLDVIVERLCVLRKQLEGCLSLEATLAIYEKMFFLVRQGEANLNRVEQKCFQLQLDSDGFISKDASGAPIKHPFILGKPA